MVDTPSLPHTEAETIVVTLEILRLATVLAIYPRLDIAPLTDDRNGE